METARQRLRLLWYAVAVQVAGRLLDFRWHATHDEFEGTSQQFEAHWLLWLGVLATLGVTVAASRRHEVPQPERLGYLAILAFGLPYVGFAVWHFIEHANGNDPGLAHVLLGITQVGMLLAAVATTVQARRRPGASG